MPRKKQKSTLDRKEIQNLVRTLSVEDIKALIIAQYKSEERSESEDSLFSYLEQSSVALPFNVLFDLSLNISEDKTETKEFIDKIREIIASFTAERLKKNNRRVKLISKADMKRIEKIIINEQTDGNRKHNKEAITVIKIVIHSMMGKFLDFSKKIDANSYDENWKWIRVVIDLANKRNISPLKFLECSGASDILIRRLYTQKQYISRQKRILGRLIDVKLISKLIIEQCVKEEVRGSDLAKKEIGQIRNSVEMILKPILELFFGSLKDAVDLYILQKTNRIFWTN